ncbi:MAG: hypothetical protein AAFY28_18640 [Actinomycetota bacterium]
MSAPDESGPSDRVWADRMLEFVLVAVLLYGLALVIVGDSVDSFVFRPLGFGAPEDLDTSTAAHVRLVRGVLGAVICGWVVLMLAIVRGPLRERERWAWSAVTLSLAVWFVVDTGFSLVVSEWEHAMFNIGFIVALAIPLWAMRAEVSTNDERAVAPDLKR